MPGKSSLMTSRPHGHEKPVGKETFLYSGYGVSCLAATVKSTATTLDPVEIIKGGIAETTLPGTFFFPVQNRNFV